MSSPIVNPDSARRVVVLVPCYNEAITIGKVVGDVRRVLPEAQVYVYDNNSTDDTARLAREAGAIVVSEPRQGKGNVLRSMFRDVDADCYLLIDGDDTYGVDALPEMARMVLEQRVDMVVGDRLSSTYLQVNNRRYHNFGNLLVRGLINRMFKSSVPDIMSGCRAFSPLFVKNFPVLSQGFEIETEMTIYALDNNFVVRSLPVAYANRPAGSTSKLNTVSDGFRVIGLHGGYSGLFNSEPRTEDLESVADVSLDRQNYDGHTLVESLVDESDEMTDWFAQLNDMSRMVNSLTKELKPVEKRILTEMYINDPDGATLNEVGREIGMCRERVRQLKNRALDRIRKSQLFEDIVASGNEVA